MADKQFTPLYAPIEPFATDFLNTDDGHKIYYEQCGKPDGIPVLFVHGGPGGGAQLSDRRWFNPEHFRAVLFDQRGCARSTPFASLENNTTWKLIEDIEAIRERLGIEKWTVFGGSWGSTLSLAYSQTHPERVANLVLRGIFTLRKKELGFFYQEGASFIYPDAWESYLEPIPEEERGDLMKAYYTRLTSDDENVRLEAAKAWSIWEGSTSCLEPDADKIKKMGGNKFAEAFARIECHYFVNEGFFEKDGFLLDPKQIDKIRHIPTFIAQGRYDVVCPMRTAWDLHRVFPEATLKVVQTAGHTAGETETTSELINALNRFHNLEN
eukprot:TRINITY_DN12720_c0_g1_i1.p1 TRINITY_DN12720_c0_g1~~TRINITY_DN12720_c0_g1_i1.p1  ORF type:complete len:371 (+),score=100.56 TRINITY_DN12720_c0_g1_i1:140-1114(+)